MAEGSEEATVVCPNCGALVPVGSPNCFICEEKMPEQAPPKVEEKGGPAPEELPPSEPAKVPEPEVAAVPAVQEAKAEPPTGETEAAVRKPSVAEGAESKAARLKAAFEAGRIPEDVYIENLKSLGLEVPEEAEAEPAPEEIPPEKPPVRDSAESKAARLKAAFEAGRIPEDVYLENLKSLGLSIPEEPEAKPALEGAPPNETPGSDEAALQVAWLKADFESGKISEETYVENLKSLGMPVPEELEAKPIPEEIPPEKPVIEQKKEEPPAEVRPVIEETMARPPVEEKTIVEEKAEPPVEIKPVIKEMKVVPPAEEKPIVEEKKAEPPAEKPPEKPAKKAKGTAADKQAKDAKKIARLKRAYETNKITKEFYIENLKTLGAPVPPELETPPAAEEKPPEKPEVKPEALPEIDAEPKVKVEIPPEKPEAKIEAAPPVVQAPKEAPVAAPTEAEVKANRLKEAFQDGRITKEIYVRNLKFLGAPVPPYLEMPPEEHPEKNEVIEVEAAPPVQGEIREETAPQPSDAEAKAGKLRAAYEAGRIPRDVYVGNLKILGIPVPPEMEPVPRAEPRKEEAVEAEAAPVKEWTIPEEVAKGIEEAAAPAEAETSVEVAEEVVVEEVPAEEEAAAPVEEAATEPEHFISKGEIEAPERSYRGVAIASAGGLVYVLIWLLFIPMLGNFISALMSMLGAVLIVVGYNVASGDAAAAARARMFSCPLCDERLDLSVRECSNCGAQFSD